MHPSVSEPLTRLPDGTVKQRFDKPVDAETLFEIVDAMPMRQDEMERDGDPG